MQNQGKALDLFMSRGSFTTVLFVLLSSISRSLNGYICFRTALPVKQPHFSQFLVSETLRNWIAKARKKNTADERY